MPRKSPVPRKPGRPTKRSEAVEKAIIALIQKGNTLTAAAALAGIDYSTLWRWQRLSARFRKAVEAAQAKAETVYVGNITSAARKGNWQAAAWWLERRGNGDWRKPAERTELSGPNGGPVEVDEVVTSDEQRSLRVAALLQKAALRAQQSGGSGDGGAAAAPPDAEGAG